MVSWTGDGLVAGYDPLTKQLKAGIYHLATPGSVDLNGVTRLHYPIGAGLSTTLYPNRLQITAPFSFTAGDYTANPGKVFSAALFMTNASNFAAGHIPTPSEILALGDDKVEVYRATQFVSGGPLTITLNIPGWPNGRVPNTKFWIMVMPTALANPNSPWSVLNDKPIAGASVDTIGRAVSMQGNRTPLAPTITSPASGSIALPGSVFNLTINPNDPDETGTDDAHHFNADVAGVQFQYAAAPTVANPTPTWNDLPLDASLGVSGNFRFSAWYIRGSHEWDFNGAPLPEMVALVDNLGLPVVAGARDVQSEYQPGRGALPTGEWQLRARTFDFGNPYPSLGTDHSQPGPLGINLATTVLLEPAKDVYPSVNTSPWSDPVRITIPAQVPPPVAISPATELAVVEDETVRLLWKYRNTHQPPRTQYRRAVQIRQVGDLDWSTVFDGVSALPYVDLPPVLTQTPVAPVTTTDTFEDGTANGWAAETFGPFVTTIANITSAPNSHAGTHYLQVQSAAAFQKGGVVKLFTPPSAGHENAALDFWVYSAAGSPSSGSISVYWLDAGNAPIIPDDISTSPFVILGDLSGLVAGWNHKTIGTVHRPPGGVTLHVDMDFQGPVAGTQYTFRMDDFTVTWAGPAVDDFSFSATKEYEWRVQATDTDGIISNYSEAARFWVVPAAGSGEVRVVPSETIDGATLGCGTHRVFVYRRGGKVRVGEITSFSHLDWGRMRDDISTAQIQVSGWDIDCGNLLSVLKTWAYELVIIRDNGYSKDRVWEGPITTLTYETDKVTIDAGDMMRYAYRRIIKQAMNDAGTGHGTTVVDRARRIIQNVFAPDDPNLLAYLQVLARDDDPNQHRSIPAYSRTAYEEIDDMAANAGLDYTVVGRSILLWGTKHRIGTLPEFKDDDLGSSVIVSEYGMSMANRYAVSDGNGVWGEATRLDVSGNDETYGLVEMLSSTWASDAPADSGTYTQAGLQSQIHSFEDFAERAIADRYPPPVVVRVPDNTTLNPSAVISIQHLVPGVVVPLRSTGTLRTVVATQKLDSIKVVEEGGKETVTITLSPYSRDDAAQVGDGTDG